MNLAQFRV